MIEFNNSLFSKRVNLLKDNIDNNIFSKTYGIDLKTCTLEDLVSYYKHAILVLNPDLLFYKKEIENHLHIKAYCQDINKHEFEIIKASVLIFDSLERIRPELNIIKYYERGNPLISIELCIIQLINKDFYIAFIFKPINYYLEDLFENPQKNSTIFKICLQKKEFPGSEFEVFPDKFYFYKIRDDTIKNIAEISKNIVSPDFMKYYNEIISKEYLNIYNEGTIHSLDNDNWILQESMCHILMKFNKSIYVDNTTSMVFSDFEKSIQNDIINEIRKKLV